MHRSILVSDKKAIQVLRILKKTYPSAKVGLRFRTSMEILVATILSAQCTDARVNIVTKDLFKKYRTVKDYANAKPKTFEQEIRSTGFYRNKAKNIINSAKIVRDKFSGRVPKTMGELLELPGVARKTANIVLGNAHGLISGCPIDTHNIRILNRLGLTKNKDPNKIEQDVMELFPKKYWHELSYLVITHGREVCKAPTPHCSKCPLNKICPKIGVNEKFYR